MAKLCILGGGFIGRFYAESLIGRRGKDTVNVVFSRTQATVDRFAKDYNVQHAFIDMEAAIMHSESEIVIVSLPNYQHEEAVLLCAKHKKAVLCTKPLGRTAQEAMTMRL
jgi:predicted dehydrogenase